MLANGMRFKVDMLVDASQIGLIKNISNTGVCSKIQEVTSYCRGKVRFVLKVVPGKIILCCIYLGANYTYLAEKFNCSMARWLLILSICNTVKVARRESGGHRARSPV